MNDRHPHQVAEELDEENIYVWDGNYYALAVTERLGLENSGGMVRVGPVPQMRWFTTHWRRLRSMGRNWGGLRQVSPDGLDQQQGASKTPS